MIGSAACNVKPVHVSGPSVWHDTYAICDDDSQSPIDIVTSDLRDREMEEFTFGYTGDFAEVTVTVENTGHSGKSQTSADTC